MTNSEIKKEIEKREAFQAELQEVLEEKLNILLMDISRRIGGLVITRRARFASDSIYMEVGVADPDKIGTEVIFGAGAEININREFISGDRNYQTRIGVGSCGAFEATDYGQVKKYLMVGELMREFKNIAETFEPIAKQHAQFFEEANELHSQLK